MILWHAYSKMLQGFYASEVYVVAADQTEAVQLAMVAYDVWLQHETSDFFYDPLTSADPGDSEYQLEAAKKRTEFEHEMQQQLQVVENNAIILRKT